MLRRAAVIAPAENTLDLFAGSQARLSVEPLRHYQQRGLLQAPRRIPSGYREYSPQVLQQQAFIGRAKILGLSLTESGEQLPLQVTPEADRSQVKQVVVETLQLVEQKLLELQQQKTALQRLSSRSDGHGSVGGCPVITFFQRGDAAIGDGGSGTA